MLRAWKKTSFYIKTWKISFLHAASKLIMRIIQAFKLLRQSWNVMYDILRWCLYFLNRPLQIAQYLFPSTLSNPHTTPGIPIVVFISASHSTPGILIGIWYHVERIHSYRKCIQMILKAIRYLQKTNPGIWIIFKRSIETKETR